MFLMFQVGKTFHAIVAAHLPLSVFIFTMRLGMSRDTAILAAVLSATSDCLTILGTHTIINSFLSPLLFFVLAFMLGNNGKNETFVDARKGEQFTTSAMNGRVNGQSKPEDIKDIQNVAPLLHSNTISQKEYVMVNDSLDMNQPMSSLIHDKEAFMDWSMKKGVQRQCNLVSVQGDKHITSHNCLECYVIKPRSVNHCQRMSSCVSLNDVGVCEKTAKANNIHDFYAETRSNILTRGVSLHLDHISPEQCHHIQSQKNDYTKDDLFILHHHVDNITENSVSPSMNILSKCELVTPTQHVDNSYNSKHCNKCELVTPTQHMENSYNSKSNKPSICYKRINLILCGFSLGVVCYMRVDVILFLVVFEISYLLILHTTLICDIYYWCHLVFGIILGFLLGGLDDFRTYGVPFLSPLQWCKFNIIHDITSALFGVSECYYYIQIVMFDNTLTQIQCALILYYIVLIFISSDNNTFTQEKIPFLICLTSFVLLMLFYSFKGHKETRFLYNGIVLYNICSAMAITAILTYLPNLLKTNLVTKYKVTFIFIVILSWQSFAIYPSFKDQTNVQWAYKGAGDSSHINHCLEYVGKQTDSTGVFLDRSIFTSGGYTVLHKDIPIFTLIHNEFHEFDHSSRYILPTIQVLSSSIKRNISVSLLSRISNYVTIENTHFLLKYLINNPKYNYLVMKKSRQFIEVGYVEVFTSGTMHILKRTHEEHLEKQLLEIADAIPIGRNATVLEYEGSWLLTFQLLDLAIERLEASIVLDAKRVRPYQLLIIAYQEKGLVKRAAHVQQQCFRLQGVNKCNQPQPKLVLYHDINLEALNN